MSEPAIEIATSREALAKNAADLIAAELRAAIDIRGRAHFVVTGGSTPIECYKALAQEDLDWGRVSILLSDERWVDTLTPESNEHMIRETLLVGPAAKANFLSLKARRGGFEEGARRADPAVRDLAPFDVTLLGMGEDGHIASLFPRHSSLTLGLSARADRYVIGVAPASPAPDLPRVSLTLAALLHSRLIIVLIAGDAKWKVVNDAAGHDPQHIPIAALFDQHTAPVRVLWAP
jgi:6-phosphogluconolactonase